MQIQVNKNSSSPYYLGAEEFALALGLAGKKEEAQSVLAATHPNRERVDFPELLKAASHSMLARGLCTISANDQPRLNAELHRALRPVINPTDLVYVNITGSQGAYEFNIYIRDSGDFCAHESKLNLVHHLEYGRASQKVSFLKDGIGVILNEKEPEHPSMEQPIPLNFLSSAIEHQADEKAITSTLEQEGWSAKEAALLSYDVVNQVSRGSLIRTKLSAGQTVEDLKQGPKSALFFLIGKNYNWTFYFESVEQSGKGIARIVNLGEFQKLLTDFLK